MRLDRILANSGLGSRTDVKNLIRKGRISLNGEILKSGKTQIRDDEKHLLRFDNKPIETSKHLYYAFYKPAGYTSTAEKDDTENIFTFLPEMFYDKRIMPVGRLDKDTTGLLLLTNNGKLNHKLLSPRYKVPRVYYVEVEILDHPFTDEDIEALAAGIALNEEEIARPAELEIVSDTQAYLTLYEGKFHEVKRMMHAIGKEVTILHRDSYGPIELMDESIGEYWKLERSEIEALFDAVRMDYKEI